MRLINTQTRSFEEFFDEELPTYHILSHRWSKDEITYKDYNKGRRTSSRGHRKVVDFCKFVHKRHGPSYVWVDTCCIDKRSSAELSEAINSMWVWYKRAEFCYVNLSDVVHKLTGPASVAVPQKLVEQLELSQWFKRGWTLQELLAPGQVIFLDDQWHIIGHKYPEQREGRPKAPGFLLEDVIAKITGIRASILGQFTFSHISIAQRMSWAAKRTTTRVEDKAYCLLGLLEIKMPLLYGEGRLAFVRLQDIYSAGTQADVAL